MRSALMLAFVLVSFSATVRGQQNPSEILTCLIGPQFAFGYDGEREYRTFVTMYNRSKQPALTRGWRFQNSEGVEVGFDIKFHGSGWSGNAQDFPPGYLIQPSGVEVMEILPCADQSRPNCRGTGLQTGLIWIYTPEYLQADGKYFRPMEVDVLVQAFEPGSAIPYASASATPQLIYSWNVRNTSQNWPWAPEKYIFPVLSQHTTSMGVALAVMSPNSVKDVKLTLRDNRGEILGETIVTLSPVRGFAHSAKMMEQIFPEIAGKLSTGTLEVDFGLATTQNGLGVARIIRFDKGMTSDLRMSGINALATIP